MANAKRPSLQKQHTRTSKQNAKSALDFGMTLVVDGERYTVRDGDLTALDIMALRRETGYSFRGLLAAFSTDPDVDLLAAFVWLARRIAGEEYLEFAQVAREIGYDVDFDMADADPEDDLPEA